MADIKVRIEVNPNQETEFLGSIQNQVGTSGSTNNLSNVSVKTDSLAVFQNIPNRQNAISGINGLSLGQDLVFDENGYLDNQDLQGAVIEDEQNPDEFVWGVVPESGEYHVKLTFINAQNLKDIIVKGDDVVGQFPTQAIVDGQTTIYSDDSNWAINLQTESTTHTIEFTHWNRANYNACLTLISVMLRYFEVDKYSGLKSVESLTQSTGQPKEIFYGVVPSSGQIEIVDVNGEIAEMINDGVMPNSNVKIEILTNNNIIQSHITKSSSYINKNLSLELTNSLDNFQNFKINQYKVPYYNYTLTSILTYVLLEYGYTSEEISKMYNELIIYGATQHSEPLIGTIKDYLDNIIFEQYSIAIDDNINGIIEDICKIAQLNLIENNNGKLNLLSARPVSGLEMTAYLYAEEYNPKYSQFLTFDAIEVVANSENFDSFWIKKQNDYIRPIIYDKNEKYYRLTSLTSSSNTINNFEIGVYYVDRMPQFLKPIICIPSRNQHSSIDYDSIISNKYSSVKYIENDLIKQLESVLDGEWEIENNGTKSFNLKDLTIENPQIIEQNGSTYYCFLLTITNTSGGFVRYDLYYDKNPFSYEFSSNTTTLVGGNSSILTNDQLKENFNYNNATLGINRLSRYSTFQTEVFSFKLEYPTNFVPTKLKLNILGYVYNTSQTDKIYTTNSTSNTYEFSNPSSSYLLNSKVYFNDYYGNIQMYSLLKQNIVLDYGDGIRTLNVTVSCADYYDIYGNKIIDWKLGQILNVGDYVRIDKNNLGQSYITYNNGKDVYFKITGRNFRYSGVPMLDLELQEIIVAKEYVDFDSIT